MFEHCVEYSYISPFLWCWNTSKILAQGTRHRGCLGPDIKKISSLLCTYKFFEKRNKKNLKYSQRVILRCYYIYLSIIHCLLAKKNSKLENGPRQPTLPQVILCVSLDSATVHNVTSIQKYLTLNKVLTQYDALRKFTNFSHLEPNCVKNGKQLVYPYFANDKCPLFLAISGAATMFSLPNREEKNILFDGQVIVRHLQTRS